MSGEKLCCALEKLAATIERWDSMSKTFVTCSILSGEVEQAMAELGLDNRIHYLPAALHVSLEKIKQALTESL